MVGAHGGPGDTRTAPPPTVRGPGLRTAIKRTFDSLDTYNYRLFFTGDLISHVGGWMQAMAEALLVYHLTHNGAAVGATFAFRFGPVLFFGLWGGMIADRFDRRRVMLVTQSLAAVLAAVLWLVVLTGVVQVWMLFAVAFLLGLVTVVDEPARQAFVEEMVGREKLPNAVALNSAVLNSARITGPALGALLIATVGTAWVFFGNAVSFFAVVIALAMMRKSELHRFERSTDTTACPRRARVRVVARPDPYDDRARRGGRHPRLQLPDLPHAHGDHHLSRQRRFGGSADGVPRRGNGDRRARGGATGAAYRANGHDDGGLARHRA